MLEQKPVDPRIFWVLVVNTLTPASVLPLTVLGRSSEVAHLCPTRYRLGHPNSESQADGGSCGWCGGYSPSSSSIVGPFFMVGSSERAQGCGSRLPQ